jgi:saccharopine dehydrogenase-like NADP-dependent oxidoreductase
VKIVIVGAGDVGSYLAKDLSQRSEDVIIVDNNAKALERMEEKDRCHDFARQWHLSPHSGKRWEFQSADLVLGVTSPMTTPIW